MRKKDGIKYYSDKIIRWQSVDMPIPVLIQPFNWYQENKQREAHLYREMVIRALDVWQLASQGQVSFQVVDTPRKYMIKVSWHRLWRGFMGWCHCNTDTNGIMRSADVEIGISDGLRHKRYQDKNEVYHVILHELGHALGLDHSKNSQDIMSGLPMKYGVYDLSQADIEALKWNYRLPVGLSLQSIAEEVGSMQVDTLYDLLPALDRWQESQQDGSFSSGTLDEQWQLEVQNELLMQRGKFLIATQPRKIYLLPSTKQNQEVG